MIVPMKKITVIVQEQDASQAVDAMRALGVLHVEHEVAPAGKDINELHDDLGLANRAIAILSEAEFASQKAAPARELSDWKTSAHHIVDLRSRLDQLVKYSLDLKRAINDWQPWGDFDPRAIEQLSIKNIHLRLYQIPAKEIKNLPAQLTLKLISQKAGMAYCALISREKIEIPFPELKLPKISLSRMQARLTEDAQVAGVIKNEIIQQRASLENLLVRKKLLENELKLHQARRGMGQVGNLTYLSGYAPFDATDTLLKTAKKQKWGILIREPGADETPPVLLRNPAWMRIIEPVMKLLGISPGYRELDVSPVFLVFFSVFFGMLIGDAGYGLVYLLLTAWFHKKKGATPQTAEIFRLFYVLSTAAVVWGILSGTFFGQAWLIKQGFRPLVPALNNAVLVQQLCFFIGALHLSIAHGWLALVKFPALSFLADLGWIMVIWVAFFLAGALILGGAFPVYGLQAAICGIILVLFFNAPRKNMIKRLGAGFTSVTFGLSFMSTFTDVVSYVRLFAVGLAGVAIADTANAMAAGLGTGALGLSAGILIRVIGHALNIVLGPISILVHGVRLNVLEFGLNHANMTWSGAAYRPLQGTESILPTT